MFKNITASNLFSWENLNYTVPMGISQIVGFNHDDGTSEGSGKSAIVNILCWVLYGKIPKDAKVDDVLRSGKKSGFGKITLLDGTEITRSRKPNDLFIDVNGDRLKGKDAKETQEIITNLLGMTFDTFCQAIYFAQNYPKKFITANESDKVKILSDIQDLSIFDRARKHAQQKIKGLELDFQQTLLEKTKTSGMLDSCEKQKILLTDFIQQFQKYKTDNLENLKKKLDALDEELVQYAEVINAGTGTSIKDSLHDAAKALNEHLEKAARAAYDKELFLQKIREASRMKQEINSLETSLSEGKCPTCKRDWEVNSNEITDKLDKLVKEHVLYTMDIKPIKVEPCNDTADDLKSRVQQLDSEYTDYVALEALHTSLISQREQLYKEYQDVSGAKSINEVDELRKVNADFIRLSKALDKQNADMERLRQEIAKLDILKQGFKEIKNYVFTEFLENLSIESTQFAQQLFEVPVIIEFLNDNTSGTPKIHTRVSLDGVDRPLGLYSGGQFRRIQISVDLALAKIMGQRFEKPLKFRILDEPFKDLSFISMEKVVELLKKLEGSTVLIEHSPVVNNIVESTFEIEFRKGVSYAT